MVTSGLVTTGCRYFNCEFIVTIFDYDFIVDFIVLTMKRIFPKHAALTGVPTSLQQPQLQLQLQPQPVAVVHRAFARRIAGDVKTD